MFYVLFNLLLVSIFVPSTFAVYNLVNDYSGDSFFEGWDFFTAADPTKGHVLYQSRVSADSKGLISIQGNNTSDKPKQAFIGVDSNNLAPSGRSAVRITTQKSFQHALVLADIAHQPGGICGVWPAFWMVGAKWPENGEIDIVEGVSIQATNQMTLHTGAGPVLDQKARFSGNLLTSNCDINAPNQPKNAGCGIADDSNITFGADFNAIGGGVYATEWTSSFIKIWFFPRNQIPADIQRGTPTPNGQWGTPNSLFQGKFNMDDHFKDLQIVMNTAFCGEWAGQVWTQTPECAALAPTCDEYVTKNPKAFEEAFWLVNSIKVFQNNEQPASSSDSATRPTTRLPTVVTSQTPKTVIPVTRTVTVQPTVTASVTSKVNITSSNNQESVAKPDVVFGLPNFYGPAQKKRRHGGAVLFRKRNHNKHERIWK